jgi:hypothetical protein
MRELIVTENIPVDGVIDMAKGWFDPARPPGVDTSDPQQVMREQGAASDALCSAGKPSRTSVATGRSRPTTRLAPPTT